MIHFGPPADFGPLDEALRNLDQFDWILLTSQIAVEFVSRRAISIGIAKIQLASSGRVAVVGPATATAAARAGFRVDYVTRKNEGGGFLEELAQELKGKRIFLPRSNLALKAVVENLEQNGSEVTAIVAYRNLPPSPEEQRQIQAIQWGIVEAALFFSPSAVQHFVDAVGILQVKRHHAHIVFVAVGPTTAQALRDLLGFQHVVQATSPSTEGVLQSLENYLQKRDNFSSMSQDPK